MDKIYGHLEGDWIDLSVCGLLGAKGVVRQLPLKPIPAGLFLSQQTLLPSTQLLKSEI